MEKVKFRDNEKLLQTLSIIFNILLLIMYIGFAIFCLFTIKKIYQGANEVAENSKNDFYAVAIGSFLVATELVGVVLSIMGAILCIVIITIGFANHFDKAYKTLSVFQGLMNGILSLSLIGALTESAKRDFNIYSFVVYLLLILFLMSNAVIQVLFHKDALVKEEKNKIESDTKHNFEETK